MSQRDEIRFKILADGVVSVDTGAFSEELHLEAEQLIQSTFDELGGPVQTVTRKPRDTQHGHTHVHPTVPNR